LQARFDADSTPFSSAPTSDLSSPINQSVFESSNGIMTDSVGELAVFALAASPCRRVFCAQKSSELHSDVLKHPNVVKLIAEVTLALFPPPAVSRNSVAFACAHQVWRLLKGYQASPSSLLSQEEYVVFFTCCLRAMMPTENTAVTDVLVRCCPQFCRPQRRHANVS
jgi:hypothetical protein